MPNYPVEAIFIRLIRWIRRPSLERGGDRLGLYWVRVSYLFWVTGQFFLKKNQIFFVSLKYWRIFAKRDEPTSIELKNHLIERYENNCHNNFLERRLDSPSDGMCSGKVSITSMTLPYWYTLIITFVEYSKLIRNSLKN